MNDQYLIRTASENVGEQIAGYHLLVDASGCDSMRIGSHENLREFAVALEQCLAISSQGEPIIERYSSVNQFNSRWSLVQISKFASKGAHFFENGAIACIDIFLLQPFDVDAVRSVVERYFLPASIRVTCVNRNFSDARAETS